MASHGKSGKLLLMSEQCATCVGLPGNKMDLRPGRLRSIVREGTSGDSMGLTCHTLTGDGRRALCRWYYEHYGHLTNGIRVMERIGGFEEAAPGTRLHGEPADDDGTEPEDGDNHELETEPADHANG